MEIQRFQKVFIIATCGGSDGFVRVDLKKILGPKTENPVQTFLVRMPPNHIVGFDPFPEEETNEMLSQARVTTSEIAEAVRNNQPPEEI